MAYLNIRSRICALTWAASLVSTALCTCYAPNGNATTATDMFACPQPDTICCALGRTNPAGADKADGATKDECLPSGLCENRFLEDGKPVQTWWRTFCTDPTFSPENCVDVCTDGEAVEKYGNRRMMPCDGTRNSEKWCCGDNTDCCETSDAIVLAATLGASSSSSTSAPSSSSTPTSSIASSTASSATTSAPAGLNGVQAVKESGLSTGAKAGIGIGAALGGLALLGLIGFFILRSRKRKETKVAPMSEVDGLGVAPGEPPKYQDNAWAHHTTPSEQSPPPAELPAGMAQHELPAMKYDQRRI